jgi:glycine/D-amino acid oxidase-like deaminating enzyme
VQTYGVNFPGVRITTKGHNLWPLKLVTQLYNSAKSQPDHLLLRLHTHTPATSIECLDDTGHSATPVQRRRLKVNTPHGAITTSYVLHATNAYASYLLPHMHGPTGIVPTRGQVIALRAACPLEDLTRTAWYTNEGFEYWFPRPIKVGKGEQDEAFPLCISGGGRGAAGPGFEWYEADDSACNEAVGDVLKSFLPGLFPGKYEEVKEPEMEWVRLGPF